MQNMLFNLFKLYIYKNFNVKLEEPFEMSLEKRKELKKSTDIEEISNYLLKSLYSYLYSGKISFTAVFESDEFFIDKNIPSAKKLINLYFYAVIISDEIDIGIFNRFQELAYENT